jgi:hypothetical protein
LAVQQNVQQNVQQRFTPMADSHAPSWHVAFRSAVPTEFAPFDRRGIIKHSTKVRISDDRNGRRASRVAQKLNE